MGLFGKKKKEMTAEEYCSGGYAGYMKYCTDDLHGENPDPAMLQNAIALLNLAVAKNPQYGKAMYILGLAYSVSQEKALALMQYVKAWQYRDQFTPQEQASLKENIEQLEAELQTGQ